jgi:hypothetical protein
MKDRLRSRTEGAGAGGLNGRRFLRARERGEAVLEEIAARVGRSKEALCSMRCPRGDAARGEAMARLQSEAGWSLREIGQRMGGASAEAVAQRIRRFRKSHVKL